MTLSTRRRSRRANALCPCADVPASSAAVSSAGPLLFHLAPPSDSPHQRIVCEARSDLVGRGPLMCPWAFATQSESHRRPHTDNRAARHGFWKVTLRIAKNGSGPDTRRTAECARRQMDGGTCMNSKMQAESRALTHTHTAVSDALVHGQVTISRFAGAGWLHLLMLERKKLFAHQAMFN